MAPLHCLAVCVTRLTSASRGTKWYCQSGQTLGLMVSMLTIVDIWAVQCKGNIDVSSKLIMVHIFISRFFFIYRYIARQVILRVGYLELDHTYNCLNVCRIFCYITALLLPCLEMSYCAWMSRYFIFINWYWSDLFSWEAAYQKVSLKMTFEYFLISLNCHEPQMPLHILMFCSYWIWTWLDFSQVVPERVEQSKNNWTICSKCFSQCYCSGYRRVLTIASYPIYTRANSRGIFLRWLVLNFRSSVIHYIFIFSCF